MLRKLICARIVCTLFFVFVLAHLSSCSQSDSPPFYTAIVTDVYKQETTVEHFSLLYWWEERGETPFLRPENITAKELIFEMMQPLKNDPQHVTVATERLPFDNLNTVSIELTETGKQYKIATKDGSLITAETAFPKSLKKDPQAGFADMKIFAQGLTLKDGKQTEFKLALDYVKQIKITRKTDS